MRMASTHAKIGRSMKNRAMRFPRMSELELACGEFGLRVLRGALVRGHLRAGGHLHSGLCLLQAADDESVAGCETLGDDPLIPERAVDLDAAFFDLAIGAHDERRGGAIGRVSDALLRSQNRALTHTFLDNCAREHAG